MTFDLATIDYATACEQPFEFEVKHPQTGAGIGVFVSVIGVESASFQQYIRSEGNAARRRAFEKQRANKAGEPLTIEEEEDMALKALIACMRGWRTVEGKASRPVLVWSGRELDFTPENALTILRQFRWLREQVNVATGDLGNFTGAGLKAS